MKRYIFMVNLWITYKILINPSVLTKALTKYWKLNCFVSSNGNMSECWVKRKMGGFFVFTHSSFLMHKTDIFFYMKFPANFTHWYTSTSSHQVGFTTGRCYKVPERQSQLVNSSLLRYLCGTCTRLEVHRLFVGSSCIILHRD